MNQAIIDEAIKCGVVSNDQARLMTQTYLVQYIRLQVYQKPGVYRALENLLYN